VDAPTTSSPAQERLRQLATLQEHTFRSSIPLIGPLVARLRTAWNNVSTKWYVRPLLQQQNDFNALVVSQLAEQAERLAQHEARLDSSERRVQRLDAQTDLLSDQVAALAERLEFQMIRIQNHDAWLIAQDREQAELAHDLAELRLLLVQMKHLLPAAADRAKRPDAGGLPPAKEHDA